MTIPRRSPTGPARSGTTPVRGRTVRGEAPEHPGNGILRADPASRRMVFDATRFDHAPPGISFPTSPFAASRRPHTGMARMGHPGAMDAIGSVRHGDKVSAAR
ncbi:hypothetical protein GCM10027167_83420 [Nocardia heshunensis]